MLNNFKFFQQRLKENISESEIEKNNKNFLFIWLPGNAKKFFFIKNDLFKENYFKIYLNF